MNLQTTYADGGRLAVVMAAYNEEASLRATLDRMAAATTAPSATAVYCVDGGSKDGTVAAAEARKL